MASNYYGSRGNSVIEMQKFLNAQGASLKVDGIWGEETEAAYNAYNTKINAKPSIGTTPLETTGASDQELAQKAANKYEAEYIGKLEDERFETQHKEKKLQQSIAALEPEYRQRLEELQSASAGQKPENANQALAQGMGRSSYYDELQKNTAAQEERATQQLSAEKTAKVAELNAQIDDLRLEMLYTEGKLSREKQSKIQQEIDKLKEERDKEIIDAIKYNNSLELQKEKMELERLKDATTQAKKTSSSSSSKGSGSSKSSSKSFYNQVMDEWYKLADGGKISYFAANAQTIADNNPSLFNKLNKEVEKLIEKGVTPKRTDQSGYYNTYIDPYR